MSIKIFTLNCWGIPIVTPDRESRMKYIGTYLANSDHHIVCLQELWCKSDYELIKEYTKDVLPYSHYFYSGVCGSGLAVFSAWRIDGVFFHHWALNGYIHKLQHGDWYGGKGVGLCHIQTPHCTLNVYCTHLIADYGTGEYEGHCVAQALELGQFLRATRAGADVSVLAGDLNTEPHQLPFRLISEMSGFRNALNGENEPTCYHKYNTYTKPGEKPICIDHILYRVKSHVEVRVEISGLPLQNYALSESCSFSDHEAVTASLRVDHAPSSADHAPLRSVHASDATREARAICAQSLHSLYPARRKYILCAVGLIILCIYGVRHEFYPLLIALTIYCIVMATVWHCVESNTLEACIRALDIHLQSEERESTSKEFDVTLPG